MSLRILFFYVLFVCFLFYFCSFPRLTRYFLGKDNVPGIAFF